MTKKTSLNDRLRSQDPELIRLDISLADFAHYDAWRKEDFLHALALNDTITTVHLSGDRLNRVFDQDEIETLMEAIGAMKKLKELFVFRGGCPSLTEELLGMTIHDAKQLKVLMLWGFDKMCEKPVLAAAMRMHNALQRITITLPNAMSWGCFDVYAMGLSQIPTLTCLIVRCADGRQEESIISPEGITILFSSKHIKSIYLENVGLTDDQSDAIVAELKSNQSLSLLDLKHNQFSDDALYAFATLLPHNKTLESIDLSGVDISSGGGWALAHAMTKNTTIRNLELQGDELRYRDEFYVPEGHAREDWFKALDYQLRLNRAGEGQGDRKRFVESLTSVSDHLDCIYHFTRNYPSHCERPAIYERAARECAAIRREYVLGLTGP